MKNNEFHSGDNAPKPLKRLVKADKGQGTYHGRYEAAPSEYHGKYEAEPSEYHGKYETESSQYHGKYEADMGGYNGRYEAPHKPLTRYVPPSHEKNVHEPYREGSKKRREKPKKSEAFVNWFIKFISVAAALVLSFTLTLNLPILADKDSGGNISIINYIKNLKPAAKEGELDKSGIQNNLNIDPNAVDIDFNDGLDLPQLIEGQYSILVLGFEPDEYNTDVMWVVQFDIGHGKLNILQIPRDTCLPDYTSSVTRKFNSIYTMGDPNITPPIQRTVNAVQENFGIPIDAYITTTCPDIVEIVNIIGGIPIHIDNEIVFEPDKVIPAGDVTLNGDQAVWFMRFRKEWLTGDIGRMQNQRRFMAAAMNKLMNIIKDEGRLKLYSYIKEIYDKDLMYTDLSVGDLGKIADFASTISMEDAQVNMVPGEDARFYAADGNAYSVYSVHKQATIDLLNKYYRPYQKIMTSLDTSIVELVTDYEYELYDDTGSTLEELENATEPQRDPNVTPWRKEKQR